MLDFGANFTSLVCQGRSPDGVSKASAPSDSPYYAPAQKERNTGLMEGEGYDYYIDFMDSQGQSEKLDTEARVSEPQLVVNDCGSDDAGESCIFSSPSHINDS